MAADDATILEADGVRVVFFRREDRRAHRIETRDETRNAWIAVCESLEGSPADVWPPSPPFQQLHVEERATGRVVLLIGMAGRTHWSAAVEVAPDRKSIRFDVAARVQAAPQHLGSEYQDARKEGVPAEPCILFGTQTPQLPGEVPATVAWQYAVSRRS